MLRFMLTAAMATTDAWMAVVPRKTPPQSVLQRCKIVSHRGEHGDPAVNENTMRAFQIAVDAGVWGIETDIRWTSDLVPVIIHDPDTVRVFGKQVRICDLTFDALRQAIPDILSLTELVAQFGGNTHLMLELKDEHFPDIEQQKRVLNDSLSALTPHQDYHILSLDPMLFDTFDIQPRTCCLPVAMSSVAPLSNAALVSGHGGVTGHYLLLNESVRQKHAAAGQKIGTGFIRSRNCLFRELNRGVEWIFTNDAVRLQSMINEKR